MLRIMMLPWRLVFGMSRASARAGYASGKLSARTGYRATRRVGLTRVVAFGAGVGVGLLVAPVTGHEMRERLRRRWEDLRAAPESDVELAERVRHQLAQSPRTWHLPQPDVEVVAGTAVLTGEAPHPSGKADIERAAAAVPGVVGVDSRLVVPS
ncbi:MAG: BON domain-containing protein [Acidimicrobiales bacterium]